MTGPAIQSPERTAKVGMSPAIGRAIPALKVCVFLGCLVPLGHLLFQGFQNNLGPDPIATITHATGFATLRLLIVSLAITPVRRLSKHLSWLIRFRRMLGLFVFFYACLHLCTYVWLFSGFSLHAMADDIAKRPYIMAGVSAWLLLLPLALTSTKKAIRRLGGKHWQRLHQLVYLAAVCGVMHYWWIVKAGVRTPIKITAVLIVLLASRVLWLQAQERKSQAAR